MLKLRADNEQKETERAESTSRKESGAEEGGGGGERRGESGMQEE